MAASLLEVKFIYFLERLWMPIERNLIGRLPAAAEPNSESEL